MINVICNSAKEMRQVKRALLKRGLNESIPDSGVIPYDNDYWNSVVVFYTTNSFFTYTCNSTFDKIQFQSFMSKLKHDKNYEF